jgi:hypothetical protein
MSDNSILWEHDEPIAELHHDDHDTPDVPDWIDQDITPNDVAAIVQGGCASGAYMSAVTYRQALETMNEHGDDVMQYIEDSGIAEAMDVENIVSESWSGIAVYFLSVAVETWAQTIEGELVDLLEAIQEDADEDEGGE